MQNTGPAGSNLPSVSDLPPLPEKWQFSTFLLMSLFIGMAVFCLFRENWLGAAIDGGVAVVLFVIAYFRYRKVSELHRQYRVLKIMEMIVKTPAMREEANSIIFTFIFPSPAIMEELHKLHNQKAKE